MQTVLSTRLVVLIGPKVPTPAPAWLMEAFESAEVTTRDGDRSGFDITFRAGRGGPLGLTDYRLLQSDLLRPGARVILMAIMGGRPHVLIDGLITQQNLPGSSRPGTTTLTVRGEDLGYAMDQKEITATHPQLSDDNIARKVILRYGHFGIKPDVSQSERAARSETDGTRMQHESDYAYLQRLAKINGFVFHVEPGEVPGVSLAYWGPQKRAGAPQRALSFNVGPESNVDSLSFQYDGTAARKVIGTFRDRETGEEMSVPEAMAATEVMLSVSAALQPAGFFREVLLRMSAATLSEAQAMGQAESRRSTEQVVVGTGELDASRYGDILKPRGIVGVRGAGYSFDGYWYVREVTHMIRQGSYRQRFTIAREGVGSTVATVRP